MNNPHVFDVAQQCLAQVTGVIIGSRRRLSWLWTPSCLHSVSRMIRPKHLPSGNHPMNTNVNLHHPITRRIPSGKQTLCELEHVHRHSEFSH